jgi:hypothetical protein
MIKASLFVQFDPVKIHGLIRAGISPYIITEIWESEMNSKFLFLIVFVLVCAELFSQGSGAGNNLPASPGIQAPTTSISTDLADCSPRPLCMIFLRTNDAARTTICRGSSDEKTPLEPVSGDTENSINHDPDFQAQLDLCLQQIDSRYSSLFIMNLVKSENISNELLRKVIREAMLQRGDNKIMRGGQNIMDEFVERLMGGGFDPMEEQIMLLAEPRGLKF